MEQETTSFNKEEITISFQNISVETLEQQIILNVSGFAKPGEILVLMGPSGSGKTTLLNYLSGRKTLLGKAQGYGVVHLNNQLYNEFDDHKIGYVLQDDIFIPTLSLRETITFYAKVKLPNKFKISEKIEKTLQVVELLNLTNQLDTLMGGGMIKGLSGGEKKRASIALELITEPPILFLDEPTSGLDSSMALSTVQALQKLSKHHRKTIITSVHQPNSEIFSNFENLLLLSGGRTVYFGSINKLSNFFADFGKPSPRGWNIADYMIDVARSDAETIKNLVQFCQNECNFKISLEKSFVDDSEFKIQGSVTNISTSKGKYATPFSTQVKAIVRRTFVRSITETLTFLNLIESFGSAILIGLFWFQTPFSTNTYTSITGLFFYLSMICVLNPLNTHLRTFSDENVVVRKERMSKMYRLSSYYIGKSISDLPALFIRPFIITFIAYWISGLNPSIWFIPTLLILLFQAFIGQSLGFFFSSMGLAYRETSILVALYFTLIMLLGGFLTKTIPVWLDWVKYLSPMYHCYVILFHIQFKGSDGIDCSPSDFSEFMECKNLTRVSFDYLLRHEKIALPIYYYIIIFMSIPVLLRVATYFFLTKSLKRPPIASKINIKWFSNNYFKKI